MKIRVLVKTICLFALGLTLSACGGGGSSSSEPVEQPPRTEKVQRLVSQTADITFYLFGTENLFEDNFYDEKGLLVRKEIRTEDRPFGETDGDTYYIYTYDDQNDLLTRSVFRNNFLTVLAEYDENGDEFKKTFYNIDGTNRSSVGIFTYDDNGRKLTEIFEADNRTGRNRSYSYDGNTVLRIDNNFANTTLKSTLDEEGNVIMREYMFQSIDDVNTISYLRDDNGNVITETISQVRVFKADGRVVNRVKTINYKWEEFEILVD